MATETGVMIDVSPHPTVYSPHVRVVKEFIEKLSMLAQNTDDSGAGWWELVHAVLDDLPDVRTAMSAVLTDDFLLIVDGKRLPGQERKDARD